MKNKKNLTKPLEIRHALERKHGDGAVQKVANKLGVSGPCISATIHGNRCNPVVIQHLANEAGCPVYGVVPSV